MRIFSSMDSKALLNNLADTCKCNEKKHVIIAEEKRDTKDEAIDCAKMYWMMGWTWEEIETILEDSEYPSKIVSEALKEAKEYAKEILNKGPFATLKAGQLVKLESGSYGVLEGLYQDHVNVNILGLGKTKIPLDSLNKVACEKLTEAYNLRIQASNLISSLDKESFSFTASRVLRVEAKETLGLLDQLEAIETHAKRLLSKIAHVSERFRVEGKDKIKISAQNRELVQLCGAVVSQEKETTLEILNTFKDLNSKIAALYDMSSDSSDLYNVLDSLEVVFVGTLEHLIDASDLVKIAESVLGQTHWSSIDLSVANKNWNKSREYFDNFEASVKTPTEDASKRISMFVDNLKKEDLSKKITAVLDRD
jgi:hypothetical protein